MDISASPFSSNLKRLFSLTDVVVSADAAIPTIDTMLMIVTIIMQAITPTIVAKVYFRKSFINRSCILFCSLFSQRYVFALNSPTISLNILQGDSAICLDNVFLKAQKITFFED